MHLKCKMTQDHVDRGVKVDCEACPGYLCIQEATVGTEFERLKIVVSVHSVYFYHAESGRLAGSAATPKVLANFIYAYDGFKNPPPCEPFDLYPVMNKVAA